MVHQGTQHGRILALSTLFLCSNAYPHLPFHSRNQRVVSANDSFIQSYANDGSIIITAKPVEHPRVIDPDFEDHLHVVVACALVLLLVLLFGLFIRHHGQDHGSTLPPTNSQPQHTPSTNTGKEAVCGLGFSQLESGGSVRVPPAARVK